MLQTPNMSYPGFSSIILRDLTRICSSFNGSIFYLSFHISIIKTLNFILISDISRLLKLGVSSLESNPNKLLDFHFVIIYFFHMIVYNSWDILPFLVIIGCKPPCSHKYLWLSIIKCLFFYILDCYDSKWS